MSILEIKINRSNIANMVGFCLKFRLDILSFLHRVKTFSSKKTLPGTSGAMIYKDSSCVRVFNTIFFKIIQITDNIWIILMVFVLTSESRKDPFRDFLYLFIVSSIDNQSKNLFLKNTLGGQPNLYPRIQ